ncbi:restriction endonuclease subunit R, partial [Bacillus cereus group sp. Bce028]
KIQEVYSKNIYKDYLSSAEKRSDSEKSFERFCEDTESVDWFYKNGDKGSEYFSIGYYDNAGTAKLFYPDYIVSVQNTIWIVETKGGFSNSGKSEDIDAFSRMKFDYLIKYANKHALQAAFV